MIYSMKSLFKLYCRRLNISSFKRKFLSQNTSATYLLDCSAFGWEYFLQLCLLCEVKETPLIKLDHTTNLQQLQQNLTQPI